MSPKRARSPGASTLVVLLILGLAGTARAASYTVRPQAEVEQTYDDNVLSDEREDGSWGTRLAPTLNLTRKTDVSEIDLQLGLARRETYSVSELDGTDEYYGATARRNLSPRFSVGLRGNYAFYASYDTIEQASAVGLPQVLYSERPELTWGLAAGDFRYVLSDSTELSGELEWNAYKYDHSDRLDLYDNDDTTATLILTHNLTPLDKLSGSLSYGISEEDPSETRFFYPEFHSHDELATALGSWQHAWSPRWTTNVQAGLRLLDSELEVDRAYLLPPCGLPFPVPALGCFDKEKSSNSGSGFIGGGSITHAYSDRGQVSFSYVRDTRTGTTSSTGASAIDTDQFSVALAHRLTARLSLSLNGYYIAYQSTDESVDANNEARTRMHSASARLDWQLRKNLVTYARFEYSDADQFRPLNILDPRREYDRRVYGIGFRYFFDLPDSEP